MAGGQERILRRRIRSVQSTKKITRAMELIAASRIVKAQARVHAAVPYSDGITEVVKDLAAGGAGKSSPLLQSREEIKRVAQVVFTADRGLCGAYNSSVIRSAEGEIKTQAEANRDSGLVTIGRKAESHFRYRNFRLDRTWNGFSDSPTYNQAREIGDDLITRYMANEFDWVQLVYTRFVSLGFQEIVVRPLIPLDRETIQGGDARPNAQESGRSAEYSFEPSPNAILDSLLPRYVEARVYAALLNAAASELAARQRAMKAATDNAEELIKTLARVMNRARQDSITTEIMEVVGGAEALQGGATHDSDDETLHVHANYLLTEGAS